MKRLLTLLSIVTVVLFAISMIAQDKPQAGNKPPAAKKVQPTPISMKDANLAPVTPAVEKPKKDPPPHMVIESKEFDAGDISEGEHIVHDFILKNDGKNTLEIPRVQPSCGCTVPKWDKIIDPGKTGTISLDVNTANMSGPITKNASVQTDDPTEPTFQLQIKANVKPFIKVSPSTSQQLGQLFFGQEKDVTFTLESVDGAQFNINTVQNPDPDMTYDITKESPTKIILKVNVLKSHPVGPVRGTLSIATSHPKKPNLTINVFGNVRDPLTITPQNVTFNGISRDFIKASPEDASLNKVVIVAKETDKDLEIKSAKSDLPFIKIDVSSLAEKERYSIKVTLQPDAPVGDFKGTLTIETNQKGKEKIPISIAGKVF